MRSSYGLLQKHCYYRIEDDVDDRRWVIRHIVGDLPHLGGAI